MCLLPPSNFLSALRLQQQRQQTKEGGSGTGTSGKKSGRRPPPKITPGGSSGTLSPPSPFVHHTNFPLLGSGKTTSEGKKTGGSSNTNSKEAEKLPSSNSKPGVTGQDTMSKLKFNIIVAENSGSPESKERAPVGSYVCQTQTPSEFDDSPFFF